MYKVIEIENKKIPMIVNGGTLREYRRFFGRDMLVDISIMQNEKDENKMNFEFLENIAWTMAHRANKKIKDIDEWLEQFDDPYAIIKAYEQINELLNSSSKTTVKPKKNKNLSQPKK